MCWDLSKDSQESWKNESGELSIFVSAQGSDILTIQGKNKIYPVWMDELIAS